MYLEKKNLRPGKSCAVCAQKLPSTQSQRHYFATLYEWHDTCFIKNRRSGAQGGIWENTSARGLLRCPIARITTPFVANKGYSA